MISNCVINLAPDKRAVFREIARVLKPGGRLAVSDIALKKPLAAEIGDDLMAYVGCIAGAIPIEDYRQGLIEAGFAGVEVIDTGADLNAYAKSEKTGRAVARRRPLRSLPIADAGGCCSAPDSGDCRPSSATCRSASPVQRERLCGQRPGVRCEAKGLGAVLLQSDGVDQSCQQPDQPVVRYPFS